MELDKIKELLSNPAKLKEAIVSEKPDAPVNSKYFQISEHPVMSEKYRPKKTVNKTSSTEKNDDGTPVVITDYVEVARLAVPFQKRIVDASAAFLCGNPIELVANPVGEVEKRLYETLKQTWDDNKLDYESKKLAKLMMSETEVAELWYPEVEKDEESKIEKSYKVKIITSNGGEALYPVFDKYGDMVAFGRAYKLKEVTEDTLSGTTQEVEYFEIYTAELNYFFKKIPNGEWAEDPDRGPEPNPAKKIPIIYYSQEDVEWADVQPLISRLETLISNHADTNDYFGSPIVKFKGTVTGVGDKYEQGKAFQLEGDADASYMTWDQSPASLELEYNNLRSLIMDFTSTPDLSIEQMKSLGTYSGIALKMLFMSAHLKASDKEENFGKSIQRRINYLKAALCEADVSLAPAINMSIKPKFEYYLPKNIEETINLITKAKTDGILSQESAVMANPLVEDGEAELKKIKKEKEENMPVAIPGAENAEGVKKEGEEKNLKVV